MVIGPRAPERRIERGPAQQALQRNFEDACISRNNRVNNIYLHYKLTIEYVAYRTRIVLTVHRGFAKMPPAPKPIVKDNSSNIMILKVTVALLAGAVFGYLNLPATQGVSAWVPALGAISIAHFVGTLAYGSREDLAPAKLLQQLMAGPVIGAAFFAWTLVHNILHVDEFSGTILFGSASIGGAKAVDAAAEASAGDIGGEL